MYTPIYQAARITARTPGTRIVVTHQPACPALDGGHCRCEPSIKIVRPGRKAVRG